MKRTKMRCWIPDDAWLRPSTDCHDEMVKELLRVLGLSNQTDSIVLDASKSKSGHESTGLAYFRLITSCDDEQTRLLSHQSISRVIKEHDGGKNGPNQSVVNRVRLIVVFWSTKSLSVDSREGPLMKLG